MNPNPTHSSNNGENSPTRSIRILTYNVGLLEFSMFGVVVFSNPPYAQKRLPFIPIAIRRENADIVCIQECYEDSHARYLINELRDLYPFYARECASGVRIHNGLLIFSKWKISRSKFVNYEKLSIVESMVVNKGFLEASIDVPGLGYVTIANAHTTAGGEVDPHCTTTENWREAELLQCIHSLRLAEAAGHHVMLAGDLNCGPEASAGNYEFVLQQGFRDLFLDVPQTTKLLDDMYSWHPKNFLNMHGPHSHTPPQRIDHVMVSSKDEVFMSWSVEDARIVFTEEIVPLRLSSRLSSTISDHYGVCIDLVLDR
jgi:endonuclease/exonuclease/phosphatase family metal-dependent hydrolase